MAVATLICASPAMAGNIAITGHDSDFHCSAGSSSNACAQVEAMVNFARAGSTDPTLPVLTFDELGSDLTSSLTAAGIPWVNINSIAGIAAASFDPTLYSAIAVASQVECGGCDNTVAFMTALAGRASAIADFFNAGGGIVGFAADGNANYYNFVPQSSSSLGGAPSSGYVQDTCGATFGVPAVNGDATHNHFSEPGTGGVSALYCVAERNPTGLPSGQNAMTLLLQGGTITTGVITTTGTTPVPEPATLTLFGLGLGFVALRRRFRA